MRRRTAVTASVAAVLVGSAIAVAVPLSWDAGASPAATAFGRGTAGQLAEERPAQLTPAATPTLQPSAPRPKTRPVRPAATSTQSPLHLSLRTAGIDAPVVPVGSTDSGAVQIPEDVRTIGWYRYSAAPGSPTGSTVLVGHVDSAEQGEGAFFRLHTVSKGDLVDVVTNDATYRYRVVARELFAKSVAPLPEIFSRSGAARLTLITCGGAFDAEKGSYRDNVVVTAVPVGRLP